MNKKYLAVANHNFYPESKEFGNKKDAQEWLDEIKEEIVSPSGDLKAKFYITEIITSTVFENTLY